MQSDENSAWGEAVPQSAMSALMAAKRLARSMDGVRGVDFGFAYKDNKMTQRRAVRFHMDRKKKIASLARDQRLPNTLLGTDIDVLEVGYAARGDGPRAPHELLQPGISIGSRRLRTTGTLGAIVRSSSGPELYLLSNWHVICGGPEAQANDEISQPGPIDSGVGRTIARLDRWLRLSEQFDAALARLDQSASFSDELFETRFLIQGVKSPKLGMRVLKSGAVSGITRAIVDGVGGVYPIDYTGFGDKSEWMKGFRLAPDPKNPSDAVSLPGDSGALWIDSVDGLAVGLHFAGEDDDSPLNDYALAHPIKEVFDRLKVEIPATSTS